MTVGNAIEGEGSRPLKETWRELQADIGWTKIA